MDLQVAATIPQRARIGTNPIVTFVRLNVRKIPNLSHLVRYHLVHYVEMHCTLTLTALSHSLHSHTHCTLTLTALSHSLRSRYHCTLTFTALPHPLHSHYHCTITLTALSLSLHSRYHCTLTLISLSLAPGALCRMQSKLQSNAVVGSYQQFPSCGISLVGDHVCKSHSRWAHTSHQPRC